MSYDFNPQFIFSFPDCISRVAQKLIWEELSSNIHYLPVEYTNDFIDYESEYLKTNSLDFDLSIILYYANKPIGIMPIYLISTPEKSVSYKILSPKYIDTISIKIVNESNRNIINFLFGFKNAFDINYIFISNFDKSIFLDNFNVNLISYDIQFKLKFRLYIQLEQSIDEIRSNFRKSYKSLINNGIKQFDVKVLSTTNHLLWDKFKKFHFKVSGRQTRSDKSWDLQHNAINNGKALLLYITDTQNDELIGAAYFFFTKDEAVYSVGVYDRALFKLPISHTIQYFAICKFKEMGISYYCVGESIIENDLIHTEKEVKISHFKKGFGALTSVTTEIYSN